MRTMLTQAITLKTPPTSKNKSFWKARAWRFRCCRINEFPQPRWECFWNAWGDFETPDCDSYHGSVVNLGPILNQIRKNMAHRRVISALSLLVVISATGC